MGGGKIPPIKIQEVNCGVNPEILFFLVPSTNHQNKNWKNISFCKNLDIFFQNYYLYSNS